MFRDKEIIDMLTGISRQIVIQNQMNGSLELQKKLEDIEDYLIDIKHKLENLNESIFSYEKEFRDEVKEAIKEYEEQKQQHLYTKIEKLDKARKSIKKAVKKK